VYYRCRPYLLWLPFYYQSGSRSNNFGIVL
jgi:hypothetical protein